jgi:Mrp family chromosome partitioning ATPase
MISSSKFVRALEQLKDQFDRIIIDSAPILAVSDPLILGSYADAVIFVIRADSTSATQAKKCVGRIIASNQALTGVVLNQFDPAKAARYYGGKNYYYENHYYQSMEDAAT